MLRIWLPLFFSGFSPTPLGKFFSATLWLWVCMPQNICFSTHASRFSPPSFLALIIGFFLRSLFLLIEIKVERQSSTLALCWLDFLNYQGQTLPPLQSEWLMHPNVKNLSTGLILFLSVDVCLALDPLQKKTKQKHTSSYYFLLIKICEICLTCETYILHLGESWF